MFIMEFKTKPCLCKMIMNSDTIMLSILSSQLRFFRIFMRKIRLRKASILTTSINSRNQTQKLKMARFLIINQFKTKKINQKTMLNRWLRKMMQITLNLKVLMKLK